MDQLCYSLKHMKKIIDANFFRNPELETYLSSDKGNIVVFNDYACMEAYKGDAIKNVSKSIEIVSKFPDQVIVLKGTRDVVNLIVLPSDVHLLEDPEQTRGFKRFCQDVQRAVCGDKIIAERILRKGQLASKRFDAMRKNATKIAIAIKMLEKYFQPSHLKALRNKDKLPSKLIDKIFREILLIAAILFQNHPDISELPSAPQIRDTYLFRNAISSYLLALWWISEGGPRNVSAEKMRNDLVDMGYVTYATFFDGLLTKDNKMQQIYQEACFLIEKLFT
jgi:hypothetical protein